MKERFTKRDKYWNLQIAVEISEVSAIKTLIGFIEQYRIEAVFAIQILALNVDWVQTVEI